MDKSEVVCKEVVKFVIVINGSIINFTSIANRAGKREKKSLERDSRKKFEIYAFQGFLTINFPSIAKKSGLR